MCTGIKTVKERTFSKKRNSSLANSRNILLLENCPCGRSLIFTHVLVQLECCWPCPVFEFNLEIWNLSMQKRWSAVTTFSSSTPFKMGTDGVTKSRQQKMGPILRSHKKKCPKVRFLSWACRRRSGIVLPQPSYGAAASCLLLLQPVSTQDKYEHWTASV